MSFLLTLTWLGLSVYWCRKTGYTVGVSTEKGWSWRCCL